MLMDYFPISIAQLLRPERLVNTSADHVFFLGINEPVYSACLFLTCLMNDCLFTCFGFAGSK